MQDYIKKHFWLLSVVVVVVCAVLAAKATGHIIEGKYLVETAEPAELEPPRGAPPSKAASTARGKSGAPLAERNMFCSDCEPEQPVVAEGPEETNPDAVPLTSLPLQLVATNVARKSAYSFATLLNTQSQSQGAYWVGQEIPGAGEVVTVAGKYVDFRNITSKRLERVSLVSESPVRRSRLTPPTPPLAATRARPSKDDTSAMLDEGIKKIDETTYEVDRSLVDKVLANPMSLARGARFVPSVKNGEANGFKVYAIRPSSVFAKIGLRNGDTITSINGFEMTSPDKALEVYTKVKEASNLAVTVTRRGQPATLNYSIR